MHWNETNRQHNRKLKNESVKRICWFDYFMKFHWLLLLVVVVIFGLGFFLSIHLFKRLYSTDRKRNEKTATTKTFIYWHEVQLNCARFLVSVSRKAPEKQNDFVRAMLSRQYSSDYVNCTLSFHCFIRNISFFFLLIVLLFFSFHSFISNSH